MNILFVLTRKKCAHQPVDFELVSVKKANIIPLEKEMMCFCTKKILDSLEAAPDPVQHLFTSQLV